MKFALLLIDDHDLYRAGLRMAISGARPDTQIDEAGSLAQALQTTTTPNVIVLDIKLPGINGVEGIALLKRRWPGVPIVMLSSQDDGETTQLALGRGAAAFLSKAESGDRIVAVLTSILLEPTAPIAVTPSTEPPLLTARQLEVLELLCKGMSNKLIARQLSCSENTVRGHVQAILGALGANTRSEAAFAARDKGLIR